MVENLKRLREPAAWIVVAVGAISIILALVRSGVELATSGSTLAGAAQDVALSALSLTLVIVILVLAWVCVFVPPATGGAIRLTGAAAWVVTIGTVLTLAGTVAGLSASAGALAVILEFLGGLLDIILKAVAAFTLLLMYRGLREGRIQSAMERGEAPPPALQAGPTASASAGEAPSWTADEASGSVWTSAAEAAEGAPATGHGQPGSSSVWHPVPRPQSAPDPATPRPLDETDPDKPAS